MASWQQIEQEIQARAQAHPSVNPLDEVRKEKLAALKGVTGRPVIIYAADWFNPKLPPNFAPLVGVELSDIDFIRDVIASVPGAVVDLLVHSPGGSAEATESIVAQLRERFDHIRVLVPGVAKSAATMLAMAANQLVLDAGSELGPTDPQMLLNGRPSPAGSIRRQFDLAQQQLKDDPGLIPAWLPVLQQYGPSLLIECQNHLNLSERLVATWLATYMFAGQLDAQQRARDVAHWLANDENFLSHARRIGIGELQARGLAVLDLRTEPALHEAVQQLHVALMQTFARTGTFKLYENSEGVTLSRGVQVQVVMPAVPP